VCQDRLLPSAILRPRDVLNASGSLVLLALAHSEDQARAQRRELVDWRLGVGFSVDLVHVAVLPGARETGLGYYLPPELRAGSGRLPLVVAVTVIAWQYQIQDLLRRAVL